MPINTESKSIPRYTFELNLDEKQSKSGGKLTKIFSGKSEKKEKTFLGSPKLHRALFRKQHSVPDSGWRPTAQVSNMIEDHLEKKLTIFLKNVANILNSLC